MRTTEREGDVDAAEVEHLRQTVEVLTSRVKMLEEQNHNLVETLRAHGVNASDASSTALELPPPLAKPLRRDAAVFDQLADPEERLFKETLGREPVFVFLRTGSGVDVGHWLGNGVVWLAVTASEVVLFAAGRKPYVERIPFDLLRTSLYNHVMGALVLSPAPEVRLRNVRLTPAEGYQVLAQIYNEEPLHA